MMILHNGLVDGHVPEADWFIYGLKEYGLRAGTSIILDPGVYQPGAGDELSDAARCFLNQNRAGVIIMEGKDGVTIAYYEESHYFEHDRKFLTRRK